MIRGGLIPSRRRATTIVELAKMMMNNDRKNRTKDFSKK